MGGTVACALAIGYLMQNGSASQRNDAPGTERIASVAGQATVLPGIEGIVLTSSPIPQANSLSTSPSNDGPARVQPGRTANCPLSARATPVQGGNAQLKIKAPCHEASEVQIHHSGLTFTAMTDATGALNLTIPALSEYAIFLISLEDKAGTVATTHIPDIAKFDRVALQWQGDTELQLHALEFGAGYGQDGHVWAGPEASGSGSVVQLGNAELATTRNVQVYSFPKTAETSGTIELSVETEVTEANCGSDLNVQALELRSGEPLRSRDLMLTLPDCSRAGEFLVFNNLLEDLTIAAK
jgi:hypothetical protein